MNDIITNPIDITTGTITIGLMIAIMIDTTRLGTLIGTTGVETITTIASGMDIRIGRPRHVDFDI